MSMLGATTVAAAVQTNAATPMVLQNVPLEDLGTNKLGICNGNFTLDTARWPFLAGDRLDVGASTFGDLNGDGRLDVVCTATNLTDPLSVFLSQTARTNTPPRPPTNLVATLANNSAHFRWNAGSDAATPALSLSYNLRVGTHPGGREVVSPMAGDDGRLRMAVLGNVQIGTNAFVTNLPPGNYFWSVQSVDMGWSGSVFSQDGQFTIATGPATRPATGLDATTVQFQGTVVPGAEAATVWFEWCLDGPLTNRTAEQVIPAGPTPVAVAQTLVLDTNALHSFRLVSSNSAGVVAGHTLGVLRTDTTQLSFPSPPNFDPTFLNYRARRNTLVHAEYSDDLVQWKRVSGFRGGASVRYYPQFNTNRFYRLVAP